MPALAFREPASDRRARVLVTVGMGPWPFDRLVSALAPLCERYDVVAQIGASQARPPCPHERFLPMPDFFRLIDEADIVLTHAGNTVRIAQRMGKVPVAVARRADLGEMANDHQVDYLAEEERDGPVIAVWDTAELLRVLDEYTARSERVAGRRLSQPLGAEQIRHAMEDVEDDVLLNPFRRHPLRRYSYAWRESRRSGGPHLDIGCGRGDFLDVFSRTTKRVVVGVDAHHGYLADLRGRLPDARVAQVPVRGRLPFRDEVFGSATMLDVLEHCADEVELLQEAHRVLRPGARLVVTVPASGRLDRLDPDDVKRRHPVFHRAVYRARFGRGVFHDRFEDVSDGLLGDTAVNRTCHQHYDEADVEALLQKAGFEVVSTQRSGLLCNILWVAAEVLGRRLRGLLWPLVALDADVFASANLFVTARRVP